MYRSLSTVGQAQMPTDVVMPHDERIWHARAQRAFCAWTSSTQDSEDSHANHETGRACPSLSENKWVFL